MKGAPGFYNVVKQPYPDFAFKPEDAHVLLETLSGICGIYSAHDGRSDAYITCLRHASSQTTAKSNYSESPSTSLRPRKLSYRTALPACRSRPTRSVRSSPATGADGKKATAEDGDGLLCARRGSRGGKGHGW
jgi:hypothetical protein